MNAIALRGYFLVLGIDVKTCNAKRCTKMRLTRYYHVSGCATEGTTRRRTPALMKTLAAIARFLLCTSDVHAIRKAIVTTREKQKPMVIACGTNVFLDNLKKQYAWNIPRARYTTSKTAEAGMSESVSVPLTLQEIYHRLS